MSELTTLRSIETITGEIRALQQNTLACAIEIGRRLLEAKELLPYGEFGAWLKEVDFRPSTANNMMRLFEEYGSPQSALFGAELKSQALGKLSYTKALSLLAVPEEEREDFIEEHDVENLSTRELDKLIKERDEAERQKLEAEQDAARKAEDLEKAEEEAQRLREELEELKSRPIDVAVKEAGPEQTETAVRKALAEKERERKKEIADLEKKLKAAEKEKADIQEGSSQAVEEKEKALSDLAAAQRRTDEVERELDALRKAQLMSNPVVTEFKTLFAEVQRMLGRLKELAAGAEENREKLEAALQAMLEAYGGEGK